MSELYIGVMSGTSLDGIDISLCEIDENSFKLIHAKTHPFDEDIKRDILDAINNKITLKFLGELDVRLGRMFAAAIENFISQNKIDKKTIEAIGLHGQTLWHEPNSPFAFSMQLGDASSVAAITNIRVVSDFRQKDIALGGQGAPFAPAFHHYLFSKLGDNIAILNIGGMANITLLNESLKGYDTGCGNVLMDYWIYKNKNLRFDENGEWAKSGMVDENLLREMLQEEYFLKEPPKSTGRELFGEKWLEEKLKNFSHVKNQDVQATLLELTSSTIADEVKKSRVALLIVCGGGVKNSYLMKRLQQKLSMVKVVSSDYYKISSEFMEAMAFAWLAHERIHKKWVKLSSVTGALRNSILGAIYE